MKVLVGSKNPVKIEAVREAFSRFFPSVEVVGKEVSSSVPRQPKNQETFEGAKNRALAVKALGADADFFVGLEGGIIEAFSKWFECGVMCIVDKSGKMGFGTTPHFELPESVVKELLGGKELGEVSDRLSGMKNTKQKAGMIGFLTKGIVDRKAMYVQGLLFALCPFLNEELYFK